jgi:hypothetical protein
MSLDTFAPTGPELVPLDEFDAIHDLTIWTEVDRERLQDSTTWSRSAVARSPSNRAISSSRGRCRP